RRPRLLRPDPADVRGGPRLAAAGRAHRHHRPGARAAGPRRRRRAMAPSGRAGRTPERRRPAARPHRRRRPPPVEPGGAGTIGRRGGGETGVMTSPCNGEGDRVAVEGPQPAEPDGPSVSVAAPPIHLPTTWGGEAQAVTE